MAGSNRALSLAVSFWQRPRVAPSDEGFADTHCSAYA